MPLAGLGYLGVDLFFILSGFVLAHVHGEAFRRDGLAAYPHFLGRRIARIFPVWLAVLALFALKHRTLEPEHCFIYAILAQAWGAVPTQLVNPPGWSVSLEWAGYLLFPLLAFVPLRLPRLATIVVLLLALLAGYLIAGGISIHDDERWYALRFVCEFMIGITLRGMMREDPDVRFDPLACLAAAGIVGAAIVVPMVGRNLAADIAMLAAFTFFLLALAQADGPLSRRLGSGILHWLGERSYSLYVVHWLFVETLWARDLPRWPKAALMIGGSIVAAAILYAAVERPARRYLRRRLG
jgi:peptidoglycan/LPS O-acetylase OafA/YrhL